MMMMMMPFHYYVPSLVGLVILCWTMMSQPSCAYHPLTRMLTLSTKKSWSNGFERFRQQHPPPPSLHHYRQKHVITTNTVTTTTTSRTGKFLLHATSPLSSSSASSSSSTQLYHEDDVVKENEVSVTSSHQDDNDDGWLTHDLEQRVPLSSSRPQPLPVVVVGPKEVLVYDTTLRDGTQGESISASCNDKLKIAKRLATFQVDFIEAGWPGSNPKDVEFFERAKTELTMKERNKLVAFGSTRRKGLSSAADDTQIMALVESQAPTICLVAKSHQWQVMDILRATPEENLDMIRDSVQYLTQPPHGRTVLVDLEHFFDGYKYDPNYAIQCCEVAVDAGAKALVLCDTNGGSMPWEVQEIVTKVVKHFDSFVTIGIHTHNDCGMAVANSMSAIRAGVGLVQGTINGIGERTGNADLCSILPSLAFHMNTKMTCQSNMSELTMLSRFVDEILNRTPNHAAPFVGASAFAHKGGLHVAAMERSPKSYQHIDPSAVGNEKRVLISESRILTIQIGHNT